MADSPLQKSPRGLLELFDLKTLGHAPMFFQDHVSASIDAFPFYAYDRLVTLQDVGPAAAMPLALSAAESVTRAYISYEAEVTFGAAGGTYASVRLGLRAPDPNAPLHWLAAVNTNIAKAGDKVVAIWVPPFPVIIPAGSVFTLSVLSDAAGADHTPVLRSMSFTLQ